PRARRQGVFRRLTLEAVDAARDDGTDLIFNTPNPRSGAGYISMGWVEVGGIGVMVRPRLSGLVRRTTSQPDVQQCGPWDGRSVPDRQPRGLRTPRTAEYLRWRFTDHPTAGYGVVDVHGGAAVVRPNLRRSRPELIVSDLFGEAAGRAVRRAAHQTDAAYLVGWFSPGTPERRAAVAAAMVPLPGIRSLTLLARPLRTDLPMDVADLRSWDLAISDLELL
ncbi:MAG TPA: hypothetical protein VMS74_10380, partial [Acidimicrobiia bacterium]|nr:hypothetical protein [Acidimicrobiia bacterium]